MQWHRDQGAAAQGAPGAAELRGGAVPRAADQQRAAGAADGQRARRGREREDRPGVRPQHLQLVPAPRQLP